MAKTASKPTELMVVNETPGEECRIAVLENNHLEELYSERTATATNVGNIYKARVAKVEPAIQAAFVDYGKGQSGFLHITDLHPKYFPSGNRKEKVGKRVPRRDRPPIQDALRPGDELLVQVLKEGIGTKGPTLTSYLSIPGRLLVVMPDMDNVGVSRKVEDDVKRREMRQMLDGLDLPEHFGFIVRTAGFGRTKTELKRDVAYLMRLWKVMDRRIKTVGAPCELYTESDLLIRTIRDVLRPTVDAIVVDSESAYERVKTFLEVIAPRSAPNVIRYHSSTPIFHAFDIERQIELIHSREVPLPSGGAIVIEQTEALVAIDVNSGRSRSARDSETNAYETNCEAVDEICRQLRLRDLGGLVVCDLIDMRAQRHRREVEDRFRNHMKKDRAKSTILKISDFGILQLTRQRMRPSLRKAHFMPCPSCDGHGEIQMPESLSADVVRQVGYLLQFEKIRRLELVCSSQVASVLLSTKRRQLVRIEDVSGKRVDVRVSDAIAIDRIDFYAYDQRGADVDISRLPQPQIPTIKTLEADARTAEERIARDGDDEHAADENGGRKKRGRRRRRKAGPADATAIALAGDWSDDDAADDAPIGTDAAERAAADAPDRDAAAPSADGEAPRRRRRRRRGRGGRGQTEDGATTTGETAAAATGSPDADRPQAGAKADETNAETPREGGRRRRRRGGRRGDAPAEPAARPGDESRAEPTPVAETVATEPSAPSEPRRVFQLARELGIKSKEILDRCADGTQIEVSNHMASLTGEQVDLVRSWFETPAESDDTPDAGTVAAVRAPATAGSDPDAATDASTTDGAPADDEAPRRKRSRRRGRRRGRGGDHDGPKPDGASGAPPKEATADAAPAKGAKAPDVPAKSAKAPDVPARSAKAPDAPAKGEKASDAASVESVNGVREHVTESEKKTAGKRRTLYRSRKPVRRTTAVATPDDGE